MFYRLFKLYLKKCLMFCKNEKDGLQILMRPTYVFFTFDKYTLLF